MAREASSSNSSLSGCSYNVFLSFRGEDTRKTFTDHLYTALVNAGFRTFRDDDQIERGEDIKPELKKAIQQSRSSVIVFSKDYASSRWCLDELVMILRRKRRTSSSSSDRHVVLPVFYDIDPSRLRNQTGSVAVAFARHQKTQSPNKVNEWRAALAEVADLGGMVLQNQADGYESKFIGKIVKVIGDKLRRNKPLSVAPNLIGMHSRVKGINSWLRDGSTDVGILVIYGIPGIGKTTIAKHVYNSNFRRFERRSFLENIRVISEQHNGVVQIQTQLLSNILNGRKVKIQNVSEGLSMLEDAVSKRVLLVLDDVDHMDQLNALLSRRDRFYPGSKIIITTRNARLSKCHLVTKVHTVESLDYNESLELFSWHAFGQDHPNEVYMEHSKLVVHQSGGLPLSIQILGSSLIGESIGVWESALKKLQSIPNGEIMSKLRICYDSLQDDHDRKLFLDIACFFVGKDKDYIVRILDGCDFYTIIGIQNLIDRCLVTIDEFNKVHVHDMIRDMGREIVRLESEELGKRSRIWHHKDSFQILGEKSGTESIEGLVLDMHMHHGDTLINSNEIVLETKAFSGMHKLRLLQLDHVQLHGCYKDFPTRLRWLCWLAFPLDSIPNDFSLENLVVLEMQYSSLKQMWKGTKCLPSLKILDLSHSHGLTKTIDFSLCPHLEKLVLIDCVRLIDVDDSIGELKRLVYLNMKDCINIRMLPKSIFMLKLLETLIISGCSNLNESSMKTMMRSMESLKVLEADRIPSQSLGTSMEVSWPGRRSCIFWTCLPRSLVELSLMGCNLSDDDFPRDLDALSSLKRLNLDSNQICSLPSCIKGLKRLHHLSFSKCRRLELLVGLPKLVHLNVSGCVLLRKIIFQPIPKSNPCLISISGANRDKLVEFGFEDDLVNLGQLDVKVVSLISFWRSNSTAPIWMKTAGFSGYSYYQEPYLGNYSYGILNTFLSGNKVPGLFSLKSRERTISFTVPLHPNRRIGGLNVFFVYANSCNGSAMIRDSYDYPVVVKVRNKSKGLKWIYPPSPYGIPGEGEDMMWLSHWKFCDHLEGGDQVAVSVFVRPWLQVKELGIECVHQEENMSTRHDPSMDPCYPFVIGGDLSGHELIPGTYLLCNSLLKQVAEDLALHRPTWFSNIFGDSDKDTEIEEDESEEGREKEEEEGRITLAAKKAGIDNCCGREWKMSKESSERDYDDNGNDDDDNNDGGDDIKLDSDGPDGDNVEHGESQSVFPTPTKSSGKGKCLSFIDVCAESSKKRNAMFEQRFNGSESLPGNNAVQSVAKDVLDEECLMQCVEILNKMEEIDDDSYSKALKVFHDVPTWRKIFVVMPDQRRKNFILKL